MKRALIASLFSIFLVLAFAPAFSQPSGTASVSLSHNYIITPNGFGVINETFTFKNSGTSAEQIPSVQLGLPNPIASRASGFFLSPSGNFSLSQSKAGNAALLTLTPTQASLAAGKTSTVSVKTYLTNIFNFTSKVYFFNEQPALVLVSPSTNVELASMLSVLTLPQGGSLAPTPAGFKQATANSTSGSVVTYSLNATNITPVASFQALNFTDANAANFQPIRVSSFTRTIVPSTNGATTVQDTIVMQNEADYSLATVRLSLLAPGVTNVYMLPSTVPPLLNPAPIVLAGGELTFASTPYDAPLTPGGNATFTLSYPVPSSLISVSVDSVKMTLPYSTPIPVVIGNYTIAVAPVKGVVVNGPASASQTDVSPLTQASFGISYSVSLGWASDTMVPAAALIFGVAFVIIVMQKPETEEEKEEKEGWKTADLVKAFEEKIGNERDILQGLSTKSKGTVGKADFDRMKTEMDELRARALQRMGELKRTSQGTRLYDELVNVGTAETEESRAVKDLLNLYSQYHSNRMSEETFQRLLPSYKKRVDAAINHLSDALNIAQKEGK